MTKSELDQLINDHVASYGEAKITKIAPGVHSYDGQELFWAIKMGRLAKSIKQQQQEATAQRMVRH